MIKKNMYIYYLYKRSEINKKRQVSSHKFHSIISVAWVSWWRPRNFGILLD